MLQTVGETRATDVPTLLHLLSYYMLSRHWALNHSMGCTGRALRVLITLIKLLKYFPYDASPFPGNLSKKI